MEKRAAYQLLRRLRLLVQTIIFCLLLTGVASGGAILHAQAKLQFFPALLVTLAGGAIIAFLVLALLSLVFGRWYCSTLCPLGTLQDIARRLRPKKSRNRMRWQELPFWLHGAAFFVTVTTALFGFQLVLNLLEPWTLFSRMGNWALHPLLSSLLNPLLPPAQQWPGYSVGAAFVTVALLPVVAIFTVAVWRGRLFCNTLCPAGFLLRLAARFSPFRVRMNTNACTSCGLCERICRAECISVADKTIDFERCVLCLDCLSSCPANALEYTADFSALPAQTFGKGGHNTREGQLSRRHFLEWSGGIAGVLAYGWLHKTGGGYALPKKRERQPVMPPGAGSRAHLHATCTACQLCLPVCPTGVIRPAAGEYGLEGLMQPVLDYSRGYCSQTCRACMDICPTDALKLLPLAEKKQTRLGEIHLNLDDCIVISKNTHCGACAEHCPTQAVHMEDWKKGLTAPVIEPEICIGCGICEYVCPAKPQKAIYVTALTEQVKADPPESVHSRERRPEKAGGSQQGKDGFPF